MPKRIAPLSETQVRNAKPRDKNYKLIDGFGLFLLVTPTNGKLWRLDYRFQEKRNTLALGVYPAISLADARQRREEARQLIANGVDPIANKKAQKTARVQANANSFEVIARERHEKFKESWSESHADKTLSRLEKNIFPWLTPDPPIPSGYNNS